VRRPYHLRDCASGLAGGGLLAKAGEPGRASRKRGSPGKLMAAPALQPESTRACDRRCPSRSGWGEASGASNRDGRRRGGDSHHGPWPVRPRLESFCKERHHPARRTPPALPEAARAPRKRFSAKRPRGSGDRAARARGLFLVAEVDVYRLAPRLTAKGRVPGDAPRKRAEGALVDGRHPGPRRPWSLTRPRRMRAWRFSSSFGGASALPGNG